MRKQRIIVTSSNLEIELEVDKGSKVHFRQEEGKMSGLMYNWLVISGIYNINHVIKSSLTIWS